MTDEAIATCLQMQCDEIEALKSIYGDIWKVDENGSNSNSIDIVENGKTATLFITLPDTYPLRSPPVYAISAPDLLKVDKDAIANLLNSTYLDNIGECVLYQWVEKLREFLINLKDDCKFNEELAEVPIVDNIKVLDLPTITHGSVITDRKSTFQGHVAMVKSVQQVKLILDSLKENKKISNATHNIYAYRIHGNAGSFLQDCEDDGETQAGSRLLHLLQIMDVSNVVVVVSRWYGGIHLGPDRFRHINNAARQVLQQANLIPCSEKNRKVS